MLKPLADYLKANQEALRANPPMLAFANYHADPVGVWTYLLRQIAAGLADYPDSDIAKIQGELYGSLMVLICIKFGATVPMDNKQVLKIVWDKIKETRGETGIASQT